MTQGQDEGSEDYLDREKENDPIEIAKQQLELGKKYMAKLEAEEKRTKEIEEKRREEANMFHAAPPKVARIYTPPTFDEVSEAIKKAWEKAKELTADAPDHVKILAFNMLVSVSRKPYYPPVQISPEAYGDTIYPGEV